MTQDNNTDAHKINPRRAALILGGNRRITTALVQRLLRDSAFERIMMVSLREPCSVQRQIDDERLVIKQAQYDHRRPLEELFCDSSLGETTIDTVIHLALDADPHTYSMALHEFNVNSTRQSLEAALRFGVKKYVFLSSDAVYKLGPKMDAFVNEDARLNLDPGTHPVVRDTIDADFLCRVKMDHPTMEVVVLRPSGVVGGGVMSGLNLLIESQPPLLPMGFDPLVNPLTRDQLVEGIYLSATRLGKGVFNVAGSRVVELADLLAERGVQFKRIPGAFLSSAYRLQRSLDRSEFRSEFHPHRLHYSLVLDDRKFRKVFGDVDEDTSGVEGERFPAR